MTPRCRFFRRLLVFVLPVVLWMAVIFVGSSPWGRFANTAYLLQSILFAFAPEFKNLPLDGSGFLYQVPLFVLNTALRRIAHIVAFAVLTFLLVRAIQAGAARLKKSSLLGAFLLALLYVGVDEWHRAHVPERHAKGTDWWLNLIGVFLVLTGTVAWFGLKALERRWFGPEPAAHERDTPAPPESPDPGGPEPPPL